MTLKIDKPGLYDIPNDLYHGDVCAGPSLSSTGMKQILADPSQYWRTSPLNPDRDEPETKKAFDIGRAAHLMVLEPEKTAAEIAVIPETALASNGSESTKAAKQFRADNEAAGKVVLKPAQWVELNAMRTAMDGHKYARRALQKGQAEQSIFWRDEATGIWLKVRPDWLPDDDGQYIVDLKTTGDLDRWERSALSDMRYDLSAVLYMIGVHKVLGRRPRGMLFLVQESKSPFRTAMLALSIDDPGSNAILKCAEIDVRQAIDKFSECWKAERWPSPYDLPREVSPPFWYQQRIERRLESETTGVEFSL